MGRKEEEKEGGMGGEGRERGSERAGTGCSRMGAECGRCSLKEGEADYTNVQGS